MPKRRTGGECQTSSDSAANLPKRKDLPPLRLFVLFFVGFFLLLFFFVFRKRKEKAAALHRMGVSPSRACHTCTCAMPVNIGKPTLFQSFIFLSDISVPPPRSPLHSCSALAAGVVGFL